MPKDHYLPAKRKQVAQRTLSPELEKQLDASIDRRLRDHCTPKQAAVLEKFGYSTEVSREEASRTIDRLRANGWRRVEQEDGPPI
jgi:hypothetical protein